MRTFIIIGSSLIILVGLILVIRGPRRRRTSNDSDRSLLAPFEPPHIDPDPGRFRPIGLPDGGRKRRSSPSDPPAD